MKKRSQILGVGIVFVVILFVLGCGGPGSSGDESSSDPLSSLQRKANEMKSLGGWATVGTAVQNSGRDDQGKLACKTAGKGNLSSMKGELVNLTSDLFAETIGVGADNEQNDVVRQVVSTVASQLLEGASVYEYRYYVSDENKLAGTKTWGALLYISPEEINRRVEKELKSNPKAAEHNMWQRYTESKAKEDAEKRVQNFIKRFGDGS